METEEASSHGRGRGVVASRASFVSSTWMVPMQSTICPMEMGGGGDERMEFMVDAFDDAALD